MFVAGLPGMGKSLVVQRLARVAAARGRATHLVRWDAARLAFERPEILERYPEVEGVTHIVIRRAVGAWVRGAVLDWHRRAGPAALLIGETPLVGERLAELARVRDDALEPLLASERTIFVLPVPSREVRRAVEAARVREIAAPRIAADATSAPPHLVRWHWDDLLREAREHGIAAGAPGAPYDPALYEAAYRTLVADRHVATLRLDAVLDVRGSVHDVGAAGDLIPTPDEVARAIGASAG